MTEPSVITLEIRDSNDQPLVRLFPDGRLEFGPAYTPDGAALTFWRNLSDFGPMFGNRPLASYSDHELREELEQRARQN